MRIQTGHFKAHEISIMGETWKRGKNVWCFSGPQWVGMGNKTQPLFGERQVCCVIFHTKKNVLKIC
jgi:hypothetical protein